MKARSLKNYKRGENNYLFATFWTEDTKTEAIKLYTEDLLSVRKIAWHFEVSHATVYKLLKNAGLLRTCPQRRPKVLKIGEITSRYRFENIMLEDSNLPKNKYCDRLDGITKMVWYRYKHIIDPDNKRKRGHFELDHRLSVLYAYSRGFYKSKLKPLPFHIVCHPANLKIISRIENAQKGSLSEFTVEELELEIKTFENKYGKVFKEPPKRFIFRLNKRLQAS